MALDFEIGLVPPQYMDAIFNRGSLELTYSLIKSKEPEIALELTRILGNNPICSRQFRADNIYQESFYVSLNSRQVRCVVEVLLAIINTPYDDTTLGMNVVAKSLIEEWMKLATAMMRELNTDE